MPDSDLIVTNPDICSGKPCIKGTRIMVRTLLSALGGGDSPEEILKSYPGLTPEGLSAAVTYAIELTDEIRLLHA